MSVLGSRDPLWFKVCSTATILLPVKDERPSEKEKVKKKRDNREGKTMREKTEVCCYSLRSPGKGHVLSQANVAFYAWG